MASSPRRVFLSHTAELREFPQGRSFVDAAEAAVKRARDAVADMAYFTARDEKPAANCTEVVRGCDVYVGLIGLRYGAEVRDRPGVSYTELEFDTATEAGLPRLVFMLDEHAALPIPPTRLIDEDADRQARQRRFRNRLRDAGVTVCTVASPDRLELTLFQALRELTPVVPDQLQSHFGPLGRGVLPSAMRRGSYFTGRVVVLRELASWLGQSWSEDGRARVVTGGPGSGKSAVLGRLVCLADPRTRDELAAGAPPGTVPPLGAIRAAMHARGRTADELAAEIAHALGVGASGASSLLAMLRETWRSRPAVVVVDAVDEAADPFRLIDELLQPVAAAADRTGIRLLVGSRRGGGGRLLGLFGASAVVLDLDSPVYLDAGDVEEYVRRTLAVGEDPQILSPYRGRPELTAAVAQAIAARAGSSFLVAQLSALALMVSAQPVDTSAADWREAFPANVGTAMRRYLQEDQPGGRWLRDLLMPLAWSLGDGLDDWQIWAEAATALGTDVYSERDIVRLLFDTPAADLLTRTADGERISYRLFHEALAEYLRERSSEFRPPAKTQQRLTEVLVTHLRPSPGGGADWLRAGNYTRTYLATHAAAGQVLDGLLEDAGFLATAEPTRLLTALATVITGRGRQIARTIERVGQQLLQASPGERASYLEMAARMAADHHLCRKLADFAPQRPWSVPWAHWQALDEGQLFGHHDGWVLAVSVVDTPRGDVVVSASEWAIRAWYLADGSPVASGMREPQASITDMVAFSLADDVIVLTLHDNGELCRATLGAAAPPEVLARDRAADQGLWLISYAGQPTVVTVSRQQAVEALRAFNGHPVGLETVSIADGSVLAAANVGGRCLLAVAAGEAIGTSDERESTSELLTWDLNTGTVLGSPLQPRQHFSGLDPDLPVAVWAAAIADRDGVPVLLAGHSRTGPVIAWEPVRARLAGAPHRAQAPVQCAVAAQTRDGELWCWGDVLGNLYLQSGDDPAVMRLTAHDNHLLAIASRDLADGPVIITGGADGAVRAWRPRAAKPAPPGPSYYRLVVTPPADGNHALIASIRTDGTGSILDADDGQILSELVPSGQPQRHIVLLPGKTPAVVTLNPRNQVAVWQPPGDQPILTCQLPTDTQPDAIAVTGGGKPTLLAALPEGRLAFFDLASGQPTRTSLTCHDTRFTVAADPLQASGALRFITATRRKSCQARLWTITGGEISHRDLPMESDPDLGGPPRIYAISFGNLSRRRIAVAVGEYSSLHIWDAADGTLLNHARLKQGHGNSLNDVDIGEAAGRALILTGGSTCSLALWPLDTNRENHLRVGSVLWSVRSVPGGRAVVAGPQGIMAFQLGAAFRGV